MNEPDPGTCGGYVDYFHAAISTKNQIAKMTLPVYIKASFLGA
jgi:hypothetical protein